jgi:hypothetical protein
MDVERPGWMSQEMFEALDAGGSMLLNELTSLQKQNSVKLQELVASGVMPHPQVLQAELTELRIGCILEQLFPDPMERLRFEVWWEHRCEVFWDDITTKARKAKLTMGPRGSGLIDPKGQG